MKISKEKLLQESEAAGFRPEIVEKVFHLLHLLESLFSHPFLKGRLALNGGMAAAQIMGCLSILKMATGTWLTETAGWLISSASRMSGNFYILLEGLTTHFRNRAKDDQGDLSSTGV